MRRLTTVLLIVLLPVLSVHAQSPGRARPGDTLLLTSLKRGTHIVVESTASSQTADLDERCRLLSVDANSLTCAADDDHRVRLVFPMDRVRSVYQIHRKVNVGAIISLALAGTLLGGLAAGSGPVVAVAFLGGFIDLIVLLSEAQDRLWRRIWGLPNPPPDPPERFTLVYQR